MVTRLDKKRFKELENNLKHFLLELYHDIEDNELITCEKQEGFYKAWHMNKTYWITIVLDNTISTKEIMNLIDKSYNLVKPKK